MLALIGIDLPQLEARLVERRRLLQRGRQQRHLRRGVRGHEAANEELERRHGRAGRRRGVSRRTGAGHEAPPEARRDVEQIGAPAALDDLLRHVAAVHANRPRAEDDLPRRRLDAPHDGRRGADDAGETHHRSVTEQRHARHAQTLHRLEPILARDRRHARGAQLAREGDSGQLPQPFFLALVRDGLERHDQRPHHRVGCLRLA